MGTGIIYAAIVVAWAAYLLPLVRHHREQPLANRPVRGTAAMRVLGKRSSGARARRADSEDSSAPIVEPAIGEAAEREVAARVEVSRSGASRRRYDAAARRRGVLFLILATAVVIAVFAYVGMVGWWSLAVPGCLLVGFVVLARLSVRTARAARRRKRHQPMLKSQPADTSVTTEPTTRKARRHATAASVAAAEVLPAGVTTPPSTSTTSAPALGTDPAAAWVAHSPVDAWDPLPVTLPTYVTKDAAPARRVRTIDLSGAAAFSAGRLPEAELLTRQAETVEELGTGERRTDGDGSAHAATG